MENPRDPRVFNILDYGAAPGEKNLNSAFIQKAIDRCAATGGGTVYCPPGVYLCGTIEIKSNVRLYLESGCVLRGSTDIKHYKTVGFSRDERSYDIDDWLDWAEVNDYHPFLYARDAVNVGICGNGMIDGQGTAFSRRKADYPERRRELPDGRISYTGPHPRFEPGAAYHKDFLAEICPWGSVVQWDYFVEFRPERTVLIINCKDVHISDIILEDASCFGIHFVNCDTVFVRGVRINNVLYVPNSDGIDIDACSNVIISDCVIYAGDDAICLKNKNSLHYKRPCRNITVTNCVLVTTCNAFKFGTESEDHFENVVFSNSVIYNDPSMPDDWRAMGGVAINMADGAHIDGVHISNIMMESARTAFSVKLVNRGRNMPVPVTGSIREILFDNITAKGCTIPSSITGLPGHYVTSIALNNIRLTNRGGGTLEEATRVIPERPRDYPETTMYGKLPASGLYCRHADGLRVSNFSVENEGRDDRPTIVCDDVKNMSATGLDLCRPSHPSQPVMRLIGVDNLFLHGNKAAACGTYLSLEGEETRDITVIHNDLRKAETDVALCEGVSADEIFRG